MSTGRTQKLLKRTVVRAGSGCRTETKYRHNKNMKTTEILPAVLAGGRLIVGEFRGFEARQLPDGKTIICSSYVVSGRDSFPVETFAPKGSSLEQAKASAPAGIKVGDKVVVSDFEHEVTKYGPRARGSLSLLTGDAK
jgi:co-chaperonin GroES (HSP10)